MSNILLVPIHLDALVLHEDKMVVEAMADFSRLPYCDEGQDVNPDVANVSEEIVSPPFQNQSLPLKSGIHLHWSLPDALTRARHTQDGQDFPRAPNRWLVTRCHANGDAKKEWIVESDYLHPVSEDHSATSVTIPHRPDDRHQPFRYMGRTIDLSEPPKNDPQPKYYPQLTAVGYGEPTFAAFYPNCHSVFGFYDPDSSAMLDGGQYSVIGWYSNPEEDYLGTFIKSLAGKAHTNEERIKALEDDFKWTLSLTDAQDFPTRMFCYAKLVFGEEKAPTIDEPITIAVGNTGTEALSAYLASERLGGGSTIEDHLEALLLSSNLEHRQLDVGAKFFEARHEKGFTAVPGGNLWAVRAELETGPAAKAAGVPSGITLPDEMAGLLNFVNDRQAEYDRAWQEIESMRVQLFSDWYKYMLCAYPPEDARDSYPDIDDVKSYVEWNVASLNQKIERAGTLLLNQVNGRVIGLALPGDNGVVGVGAVVGPQPPLAGALADAINKLQDFMDVRRGVGGAGPAYRLKQISGPRYWRPTEPSVLIPVAKPSERHGQDGRPGDGLLETQLLTGVGAADPSREQDLRGRVRERIAEIGDGASEENFAFSIWARQPWNPFMLEWEVELFPVELNSNLDPTTGRYEEEFIKANYQLEEDRVDLSVKPSGGATTSAANVYSGRSILTPHAGAQLARQVEAYLKKEVLPQYLASVPEAKQEDDYLGKNFEKLLKWYETAPSSPLAAVENRDEDAGLTALRAWQVLMESTYLSQSLGGFNDALLMHKQTMQLSVADPLGFDDYQPGFPDAVSAAVSRSIYSAPSPLNDFNPIRSGALKILQLRLVDTFGQVRDLDVTRVIPSEPLTVAGDNSLVRLPPRLAQPARINFRWLAAAGDEQEMNDHPATTPVCGWVLANNLDNSLMIYDDRGKALGSLVMKADADLQLKQKADPPPPKWEPAPGGLGAGSVGEILNPHLQKMVVSIQGCGLDFLDDFISAIDSAVENIEPENFAHHQDLALLMGRPLALVRASLNLELKGLPAAHQGWNEFRQDLQRETRDDKGLSRVLFPIRVGEYRQFNDGTVGYWKEAGNRYEGDVFYAAQSDEGVSFKDTHLKTHRTDPDSMVLFQSVSSEPQILSLLLDPRGLVHATSGILPAKAISIPPDQYAAALQAIEITFLSTPVLTDVGKTHLPLPDEPGYQWSWLQTDGRGTWSEVSTRGLIRKEALAVFGDDANAVWEELIEQRWIELLDPKEPTRAGVTAKDKRKSQTLKESLKDKTPKIEDLLDRSHIGDVNPNAKFSGPQEIREGWLKLGPAPVTDSTPQQ